MALNTETLLIIFVGLTGLAVLLQACVLFAMYISLRKAAQSAQEASDDLKTTVLPMVRSTRELVERVTPQILSMSANVIELSDLLKKETQGFSVSAKEIMQRVELQIQRLDAMLTAGLNTVDRAALAIESTVAAPVRQVNGIIAAVKAVVETYRSSSPNRRARAAVAEDDPGI